MTEPSLSGAEPRGKPQSAYQQLAEGISAMASSRCCLEQPLVPAGTGRALLIALGSHFVPFAWAELMKAFQRKKESHNSHSRLLRAEPGQLSLPQPRGLSQPWPASLAPTLLSVRLLQGSCGSATAHWDQVSPGNCRTRLKLSLWTGHTVSRSLMSLTLPCGSGLCPLRHP